MNAEQKKVLELIKSKNIRFVRLVFTDVTGRQKAIAIDPGQLEDAFVEGIGFDGSSIEALTRVNEADMLLVPDASTLQVFTTDDGRLTARLICSIHTPDGLASLSDPRGVLQRTVERAHSQGFTPLVHPEIEFYLLKPPLSPDHIVPVDYASYFDYINWGNSNSFRRNVICALQDAGIAVEFSHHEGGSGQNEIDLKAADALKAADNIIVTKSIIEECALRENMVASFMPKPFIDQPGSGLHLHLSLFSESVNAFYSPSAQYQLSSTARSFIAGILTRAREFCAITNQHVNSYKRLINGHEAPAHICWGHNNRSVLVRVPIYKPTKASSARIEYRGADVAMNPYLGIAVLIQAGLEGIEQKLILGDDVSEDVTLLNPIERKILGIEDLPRSLDEALALFRKSDFVPFVLGEQVFDYVLRNGEREWESYNHQITQKEYLRFLTFGN